MPSLPYLWSLRPFPLPVDHLAGLLHARSSVFDGTLEILGRCGLGLVGNFLCGFLDILCDEFDLVETVGQHLACHVAASLTFLAVG